jgi:hypothetical protein
MENMMRKGRRVPKKQVGGYLRGPSHEAGGIPAYVPGDPPIELEGREFIVNARTTEVLGVDFLEKLNRTQSPHHTQPGFSRGELPGSKFKNGGPIGRNNMRRKRRGGTTRKFHSGGASGYKYPGMHDWMHKYWKQTTGHYGPMNVGPINDKMHRDLDSTLTRFKGRQNVMGTRPGVTPYNPSDVALGGGYGQYQESRRKNKRQNQNFATGGYTSNNNQLPYNRSRYNNPYQKGGRIYEHGGHHCGGPGQMACGGNTGGYRRGGRIYENGGGVYVGSPSSCMDGMGNARPC